MIGYRNFIIKNAKNISERNAKNFASKFHTVTEKSQKKYNDLSDHVRSKSKSV